MSNQTEWTVGYHLSSGNVAVLAGSPKFQHEWQAQGAAAERNRQKPFLTHVAIRAAGPIYG